LNILNLYLKQKRKEIGDNMKRLEYPAIYKHFKNKLYAVMGESKPIEKIENVENKMKLIAFHTEINSEIIIYKFKNKYIHLIDDEKENLILYKALYDDKGIYARPEEMFLSEVNKEKYPEIEQKYRFELFK
jgi:hypothetical protein